MPLIINDHTCQVTTNLYLALMHLTKIYPFLVIWVDALCINQKDPIERANQVRIMGDIYQKAEHVLVWIGEADETSSLGMKAIEKIGSAYYETGKNTKESINSIDELPEEAAFSSIANILKREWWSRAWTLQEIVLGKSATAVCGTDSIDWVWVANTKTVFLDIDGLRNSKLLPAVENHTTIFEQKLIEGKINLWRYERTRKREDKRKQDILEIVIVCREFAATNPLDKIYSGLALAAPFPGFEIDYQITPRQLYTNFATTHIRNNQNLKILRDAGIGCSQVDPEDPVPSWVPDFRYSRPSSPIPLTELPDPGIHVVAEISGEKLTVRGISADQVVSSTPHQPVHPSPWLKAALEEFPLTYRNSPLPYIQAYFRTLLMEYNYNTGELLKPTHKSFFAPAILFSVLTAQFDEEYIPKYIKSFAEKEGRPLHQSLLINMLQQDNPDVAEAYLEFEDDVEKGIGNAEHLELANFNLRLAVLGFDRCFVKTEDGYMGLTPRGTRIGDWIVVVKGCDVPLVLRRVEEKEEFVLVGECFVFGLMPHLIFGIGLMEERTELITIV